MRTIFLLLSSLVLVPAAITQTVTQHFTGIVEDNSLDAKSQSGFFSAPPGSQVSGTFVVNLGNLGTPIADTLFGYPSNQWSQHANLLGVVTSLLPNTDSLSATSSGGSVTVQDLQSVALVAPGNEIDYGQVDASGYDSTVAGSVAVTCFATPSGTLEVVPLPLLKNTLAAFPLTSPAGCTPEVTFRYNLNQYTVTVAVTSLSGTIFTQKSGGNPGCQPGACQRGNPISIGTGNKYEHVEDYRTAGGNPLVFERSYNSLGNAGSLASTLGVKWRSNWDRYLRIVSSTSVVAERADGQEINFSLAGSVWTPDSDIDLTLTQNGTRWTLTDGNDSIEAFTAVSSTKAILQSVKTRNGYTQTLYRNTDQTLATVTDSYGRSLSLTYQNGLLNKVTTPENTLTFGYQSAGTQNLLASVGYANTTSPTTTVGYIYDNPSLPTFLTGIKDENGNRFATWTYDSQGRALTSQHGNGAELTTVTYNDMDNSRTVTNALGVIDTYTFSLMQGVPKVTKISRAATPSTDVATKTFTYDANGYTNGVTDWNNNTTTYINNAHGQPQVITEAFGKPEARTTTIVYDPVWVHLPFTVSTPGLTTTLKYDSAGNLHTKTLSDTTATSTPYPTSGTTRTWTYGWTNYLPTSITGPRTDLTVPAITTLGYDSSGALTSMTNALGQQTKITPTPGGRPQKILDPNNVQTQLTYDGRQRLITQAVTTAAGVLTTSLGYDPAGNLISTTKPDGASLTNTYDSAHRLTKVTDSLGNYTSYTLDPLGNRIGVNVYAKGGTTPTWKHSATFDALGRLLTSTSGAGQTTTQTFDPNGNILSLTDGLGHKTTNIYDALNRITTSTDSNGGVTAAGFDPHDRIVSVTDANGNTTSYTRDGFGDVLQRISPDSGTAVFHYDADGNVTSKTDAMNVITAQTFDALDRPLTRTYPASPAENVSFTYDQTGAGFAIGRLTAVTDQAGSLSRQYDELGNLTREQRTNGATALTTGYSYDKASHIATMTYPDGTLVGYQYNAAGYTSLVTAKLPGATKATTLATIDHEPFGPLDAATFGNGITESWTFDQSYRSGVITDTLFGGSLQNLTYGYDLANNVTSVTDAVNAANSQTLGYDTLDRLNTAISGSGGYGSFGWQYDKVGNRLTQTRNGAVTTYTYTPGTNRLATISPIPLISAQSEAPDLGGHGSIPVQALFGTIPAFADGPTISTGPPSVAAESSRSIAVELPQAPPPPEIFSSEILHQNKGARQTATLTPAAYIVHGSGTGFSSSRNALNVFKAPALAAYAVFIPLPPPLPPSATVYAPFLFSIPVAPGIRVFYTENGTAPTTSSYLYTGPFWVGSSLLIRAISVSASAGVSGISSAQYLFATATPNFSLAGGTYSSYQSLTMSDATPGATIFYTVDGSTPTNSSPQYTGPLQIQRTETVNAVALANNQASGQASAQYTIILPNAAMPVLSPPGGSFGSIQNVTASDSTPGATIYFTLDGTVPTTASPRYTSPITVASTQTVQAIAAASGYSNSAVASATYTLPGRVTPPGFSIPEGTYSYVPTVSIRNFSPGATIYFTVDGSVPTASSTRYTSPITVSTTETLKAIAVAAGFIDSTVSSATYNIGLTPLPQPQIQVLSQAGTYANIMIMGRLIGTPLITQTFFYTTDGSVPSTNSLKYTSPFVITGTKTINAIATAIGDLNSQVATSTIIFSTLPTPTISLASGTYSTAQTVTLTDSQWGSLIFYTLDGTTPTSSSNRYTTPIAVTSAETIKAIAVTPIGVGYSPVATATYTISSNIATVTTNANGNITSIPPANSSANATFGYNNANRLWTVTGSPTAATFLYDYAGQRFSKANPGTPPTVYSYAQGGTLITENDNGTITDYIYVDGRPIAQIQPGATLAANQVSYVLTDRLGTPQRLVNSSGATVWSTTYQPFGAAGTINAIVNQNLRFPGQTADAETGFSYNINRNYMPNLGRYLEADPAGLAGGQNTFLYASGNPIRLQDRSGLLEIEPWADPIWQASVENFYDQTVTAEKGLIDQQSVAMLLNTLQGHTFSIVPDGVSPQTIASLGLTKEQPSLAACTQSNPLGGSTLSSYNPEFEVYVRLRNSHDPAGPADPLAGDTRFFMFDVKRNPNFKPAAPRLPPLMSTQDIQIYLSSPVVVSP